MAATTVEDLPRLAHSVKLETVNCGLCGSPDYYQYETIDEWRIVRCRRCGLCFTNPRPTVESLPSFYDASYFSDGEVDRFGCLLEGAPIDYSQRIVDIESRFNKRGHLLEIGAAEGGFLSAMRARGWKVSGVELSAEAVSEARTNEAMDIYRGSLADFETAESFDVVCMYHSLEHVPDPGFVIERSFELLNTGGIIVIEAPNLNGFDAKFNRRRRLLSYDLPRHLSHFAPAVLSKKLGQTGFQILDVDLYYPDFILRLAAARRTSAGTKEPFANNPVVTKAADFDGLPMAAKDSNWKTRLLKSASMLFPGWRFTIVARK